MEIKTYRAKSLQQALQWIQSDLGPEAAVLHTRELRSGLMEWLRGRQLEVTAGVGVGVPSRFSEFAPAEVHGSPSADPADLAASESREPVPPAHELDYRGLYRHEMRERQDDSPSLVEELCSRPATRDATALAESAVQLYLDLIDVDMDAESARELIDRVRSGSALRDLNDTLWLRARLARLVAEEIHCSGPIAAVPGERRVVAFVGPTGVGKTTTIAKLAARFHLRERRRVGLVTVDTYRVAAVDQLQTYADIIDLPMEVVADPREMRQALASLADRDLVLLDTAGHNPADDIRLQELKSLLQEARPDEVQLVASGVANVSSLKQVVARFADIGATRLILTKLDEATCLGHLWPLLRNGRLPLSYLTHGQNVPEDIAPADARNIARRILRMDGGR